MADPATILNDPDFVSANAATKQAIFTKHVANDPDFKNANSDTQQAIKARFGFEVAPAASSGIPGPRAEKPGFFSRAGAGMASLADTTIGSVLPLAGQVVQAGARPFTSPQQAEQIGGAVSSALDKPFGKAFGVTDNPAYKAEASQQIMNFIGANINKGADWISKQTGLPVEDVRNMIGTSTLAVPKVVSVAAPVVKSAAIDTATAIRQSPVGQMIEQPIQARNARVAQERSLQCYQNAPRIDAAKDALDLGVALNPATSNPTPTNKLRAAVVGSDTLDTKLAQYNQGKFTEAAKTDLGLAPTDTLNSKAFEKSRARSEVSGPYDAVRGMTSLEPTADTMSQLESMRVQPLVGDTGQAAAANSLLDAVKEQLAQGVDGKTLVDSIRARRREAQAIYNQQSKGITPPAPEAIARADMNMGVANALENMIESNLRDSKALGAFRDARTALARTYDYERATNLATGQLDPQVIAKMAAEGKPLTGTLAKIGNVAANYPEVSKSGMLNEPNWRETLPRSGLAGTAGALLGSPLGLPGSIAGGAIGATVGNVSSGAMARGMTKPGFQASKAMPPDYRLPITNNLQPGTSNLAIFDPVNALVNPPPQTYTPNWTYARPQPEVKTGVQPMPPQLEAPSGESTMRTVAEQRKFEYNMQKALEEQAAQEQAAREATGRKVTKGGVVIGEEPVQGQGLPQPASLAEASRKVAAGQLFNMTAPEKVMWDRTRISLEQAAPELTKLSDKQIASKAMDRAWVQETMDKAREKAAAFDDIAKRASDAQAKFEAGVKRDQMLDLLTTLEDNLRNPRPTSAGGQGPKTREAIRNKLLGGNNQNNLR